MLFAALMNASSKRWKSSFPTKGRSGDSSVPKYHQLPEKLREWIGESGSPPMFSEKQINFPRSCSNGGSRKAYSMLMASCKALCSISTSYNARLPIGKTLLRVVDSIVTAIGSNPVLNLSSGADMSAHQIEALRNAVGSSLDREVLPIEKKSSVTGNISGASSDEDKVCPIHESSSKEFMRKAFIVNDPPLRKNTRSNPKAALFTDKNRRSEQGKKGILAEFLIQCGNHQGKSPSICVPRMYFYEGSN